MLLKKNKHNLYFDHAYFKMKVNLSGAQGRTNYAFMLFASSVAWKTYYFVIIRLPCNNLIPCIKSCDNFFII